MKKQHTKLAYAWCEPIKDRFDGNIELVMKGKNTAGTEVIITTIMDEWTIRNIAEEYATILNKRVASAIQQQAWFHERIAGAKK